MWTHCSSSLRTLVSDGQLPAMSTSEANISLNTIVKKKNEKNHIIKKIFFRTV